MPPKQQTTNNNNTFSSSATNPSASSASTTTTNSLITYKLFRPLLQNWLFIPDFDSNIQFCRKVFVCIQVVDVIPCIGFLLYYCIDGYTIVLPLVSSSIPATENDLRGSDGGSLGPSSAIVILVVFIAIALVNLAVYVTIRFSSSGNDGTTLASAEKFIFKRRQMIAEERLRQEVKRQLEIEEEEEKNNNMTMMLSHHHHAAAAAASINYNNNNINNEVFNASSNPFMSGSRHPVSASNTNQNINNSSPQQITGNTNNNKKKSSALLHEYNRYRRNAAAAAASSSIKRPRPVNDMMFDVLLMMQFFFSLAFGWINGLDLGMSITTVRMASVVCVATIGRARYTGSYCFVLFTVFFCSMGYFGEQPVELSKRQTQWWPFFVVHTLLHALAHLAIVRDIWRIQQGPGGKLMEQAQVIERIFDNLCELPLLLRCSDVVTGFDVESTRAVRVTKQLILNSMRVFYKNLNYVDDAALQVELLVLRNSIVLGNSMGLDFGDDIRDAAIEVLREKCLLKNIVLSSFNNPLAPFLEYRASRGFGFMSADGTIQQATGGVNTISSGGGGGDDGNSNDNNDNNDSTGIVFDDDADAIGSFRIKNADGIGSHPMLSTKLQYMNSFYRRAVLGKSGNLLDEGPSRSSLSLSGGALHQSSTSLMSSKKKLSQALQNAFSESSVSISKSLNPNSLIKSQKLQEEAKSRRQSVIPGALLNMNNSVRRASMVSAGGVGSNRTSAILDKLNFNNNNGNSAILPSLIDEDNVNHVNNGSNNNTGDIRNSNILEEASEQYPFRNNELRAVRQNGGPGGENDNDNNKDDDKNKAPLIGGIRGTLDDEEELEEQLASSHINSSTTGKNKLPSNFHASHTSPMMQQAKFGQNPTARRNDSSSRVTPPIGSASATHRPKRMMKSGSEDANLHSVYDTAGETIGEGDAAAMMNTNKVQQKDNNNNHSSSLRRSSADRPEPKPSQKGGHANNKDVNGSSSINTNDKTENLSNLNVPSAATASATSLETPYGSSRFPHLGNLPPLPNQQQQQQQQRKSSSIAFQPPQHHDQMRGSVSHDDGAGAGAGGMNKSVVNFKMDSNVSNTNTNTTNNSIQHTTTTNNNNNTTLGTSMNQKFDNNNNMMMQQQHSSLNGSVMMNNNNNNSSSAAALLTTTSNPFEQRERRLLMKSAHREKRKVCVLVLQAVDKEQANNNPLQSHHVEKVLAEIAKECGGFVHLGSTASRTLISWGAIGGGGGVTKSITSNAVMNQQQHLQQPQAPAAVLDPYNMMMNNNNNKNNISNTPSGEATAAGGGIDASMAKSQNRTNHNNNNVFSATVKTFDENAVARCILAVQNRCKNFFYGACVTGLMLAPATRNMTVLETHWLEQRLLHDLVERVAGRSSNNNNAAAPTDGGNSKNNNNNNNSTSASSTTKSSVILMDFVTASGISDFELDLTDIYSKEVPVHQQHNGNNNNYNFNSSFMTIASRSFMNNNNNNNNKRLFGGSIMSVADEELIQLTSFVPLFSVVRGLTASEKVQREKYNMNEMHIEQEESDNNNINNNMKNNSNGGGNDDDDDDDDFFADPEQLKRKALDSAATVLAPPQTDEDRLHAANEEKLLKSHPYLVASSSFNTKLSKALIDEENARFFESMTVKAARHLRDKNWPKLALVLNEDQQKRNRSMNQQYQDSTGDDERDEEELGDCGVIEAEEQLLTLIIALTEYKMQQLMLLAEHEQQQQLQQLQHPQQQEQESEEQQQHHPEQQQQQYG